MKRAKNIVDIYFWENTLSYFYLPLIPVLILELMLMF